MPPAERRERKPPSCSDQLVEPDGKAYRVVVNELGCAPLEAYAGAVVLELARLGDFRPTGKDKSSWYGSEINFTLE